MCILLEGMLCMKSMKQHSEGCTGFSEAFYGSATVGERGQIVIPSEARAEMGFLPGDKVLIMRHPLHKGVMLFKIDAMREFMDDFSAHLAKFEEEEK